MCVRVCAYLRCACLCVRRYFYKKEGVTIVWHCWQKTALLANQLFGSFTPTRTQIHTRAHTHTQLHTQTHTHTHTFHTCRVAAVVIHAVAVRQTRTHIHTHRSTHTHIPYLPGSGCCGPCRCCYKHAHKYTHSHTQIHTITHTFHTCRVAAVAVQAGAV